MRGDIARIAMIGGISGKLIFQTSHVDLRYVWPSSPNARRRMRLPFLIA